MTNWNRFKIEKRSAGKVIETVTCRIPALGNRPNSSLFYLSQRSQWHVSREIIRYALFFLSVCLTVCLSVVSAVPARTDPAINLHNVRTGTEHIMDTIWDKRHGQCCLTVLPYTVFLHYSFYCLYCGQLYDDDDDDNHALFLNSHQLVLNQNPLHQFSRGFPLAKP